MSKRYRVILVGCSCITTAWLSACRDHFANRLEFVGNVDLNVDAAAARATEYAPEAWSGISLDDALDSGTTPSTVVTDNIQSFAMVEHAILSAESGQRISIQL